MPHLLSLAKIIQSLFEEGSVVPARLRDRLDEATAQAVERALRALCFGIDSAPHQRRPLLGLSRRSDRHLDIDGSGSDLCHSFSGYCSARCFGFPSLGVANFLPCFFTDCFAIAVVVWACVFAFAAFSAKRNFFGCAFITFSRMPITF